MNAAQYGALYEGDWPSDDRRFRLEEIAQDYLDRCEAYDRVVCRGRSDDGIAMPTSGREQGLISQHARAVRQTLEPRVRALGFTWADLMTVQVICSLPREQSR